MSVPVGSSRCRWSGCLGAALAVVAFAVGWAAGCRCHDPPGAPTAALDAAPADAGGVQNAAPDRPPERGWHPLLGREQGLDHVGVAVADLHEARDIYMRMGFREPSAGRLPNGIENVNFYFGDTTYLELLRSYDRRKARWLAEFLDAHEGAVFHVLCVSSLRQAASWLSGRGLPTRGPIPGRITEPGTSQSAEPMWHTMFLEEPLFGSHAFFFIEYASETRRRLLRAVADAARRRRIFAHPNTALGVTAVWIAVHDLDAWAAKYARMGLTEASSFVHEAWGGAGRVIRAGRGAILLVQGHRTASRAASHLEHRGESVVGVSIAVQDLETARFVAERGLRRRLLPYDSVLGRAIAVPPEVARGVWIELVQPQTVWSDTP